MKPKETSVETTSVEKKRKRWDAVIDRIAPDSHVWGVEVGVWRGIMSRELLAARISLTLELVDPYRTGLPGTAWWDSGSVMPSREQELYDAAYARARETTAFAGDRVTFHKMPSVAAAESFADRSLDFVFVDGDHSYEGVVADLIAWLPKIRIGGWIGGHDWDKPQRGQVTEAVRACFPRAKIETDAESTWFLTVKKTTKAAKQPSQESRDEASRDESQISVEGREPSDESQKKQPPANSSRPSTPLDPRLP